MLSHMELDDGTREARLRFLQDQLTKYLQSVSPSYRQTYESRMQEHFEWLQSPSGSKWLAASILVDLDGMLEDYGKYLQRPNRRLCPESARQYVSTVRQFRYFVRGHAKEVLREATILLGWLGR